MTDFFRRESGRLIAWLTARAGAANIDTVEDAVQDAMVAALRCWPIQGIPKKPAHWLFAAARNALTDRLRRARFETPSSDDLPELSIDESGDAEFASEARFNDESLRLIVYCCHPALPSAMQLALTLRLACGLGVREIAGALLASEDSISQRIVRAKRELRDRSVELELPPTDELVHERLPVMLQAIYLMFDAGYLSAHHEEWVRPALCTDALRIVTLLANHEQTAEPETQALAALLYFTAARLPARTDSHGRLVPLADQNRALWDRNMIHVGFSYFDAAIRGDVLTRYHIEAAIAAAHAQAPNLEETNWAEILRCYDQLCELYPSPVASLNRIIALRFAEGARRAMDELHRTGAAAELQDSLMYHTTFGELQEALGEMEKAGESFQEAARLAGSTTLAEMFRAKAKAALER
jgi:RNA polymerase sigma-70 factor (ECF subfamily)